MTKLRSYGTAVLFALVASLAKAQSTDPGQRGFQARCVGCHGQDGTGGEHGPRIVDIPEPRVTSLDAARKLILNGLPERGMPAFRLSADEAAAIAGYVMALKTPSMGTPAAREPVEGDQEAGQRFFEGQANCASCHMVRGRGGVVGPDLSNVGQERTLSQIQRALTDPGSALPTRGRGNAVSYRAITVRLRDGQNIRGLMKNESAFDLQLLGLDGKLHLLAREQVDRIIPEKSVMPKVEASTKDLRDLVAYLSRLTSDPRTSATLPDKAPSTTGLAFADVIHPKAGSWPTYHGNVSGNRFSPLNQINVGNVEHLAPKWMFMVGAPGGDGPPKVGVPSWSGLEGTPVMVDGVMYVTSVNQAYALDARSGREIWHYSRPRSQGLAGDAGGGINRGAAVLGDRIFMVTDNAHLIALHRLTGQLLWDAQMADSRQNYGATGAPLVVNDLVITGVSGGDEGIRGFVDAYKASTGERAWRFWTVPARGEPHWETWMGSALEHGCAGTWLTGTYDPEANLLYWPTGNPCPDYNGDERKGDNLYSDSILALDPASGKLKWYYQFTPHDLFDWDATETPMLLDAEFRGRSRKLLVQANRNGFFYALDRLTGEVLMAEPFVKVTWASGVGSDGRPILIPGTEPTIEGTKGCSMGSATNWPSTAFNPATGLFYVMAMESCNIYTKNDDWWEAGQSFYGGGSRRMPGDVPRKFLRALDLQTGKLAWERPEVGEGFSSSGVLTTAGGLVFYGDGDGALEAVDAKNGKPLWHFNTSQRWKASPMAFQVEGKQYIAVAAGPIILTFGLP